MSAYHTCIGAGSPRSASPRSVLTGRNADVSFGFTRDSPRDSTLNRAGNPHPSVDLRRRDFLVRFCQGAGAMLIPRTMWGITFPEVVTTRNEPGAGFHLQPHYRQAAARCDVAEGAGGSRRLHHGKICRPDCDDSRGVERRPVAVSAENPGHCRVLAEDFSGVASGCRVASGALAFDAGCTREQVFHRS